MILEEVEALLSEEGASLLDTVRNEGSDLSSFLLSYGKKISQPLRTAIAEQLASHPLLKRKHPSLVDMGVLCEKSVLEQSTAEEVARYRASRYSGGSFIDCTGGMGVDTMHLAKSFETGVFCELDVARAKLFQWNASVISPKIDLEVVIGDSIEYLKTSNKRFDLLFIDPARRDEGERFFDLERSLPNIVEHWQLLLSAAQRVVVKLSPMVDIPQVLQKLTSVVQVTVVSLDGEVKEIELEAEADFDGAVQVKAALLKSGAGLVHLVEGDAGRVSSGVVQEYLYDCDAAVVKASQLSAVACKHNLNRVHMKNRLLTGSQIVNGFPGRLFKVLCVMDWQRKSVKKYLKKEGIDRATVISREFPLSVQEIRFQFALDESDSIFLFFTINSAGKRVVIHAERLHA